MIELIAGTDVGSSYVKTVISEFKKKNRLNPLYSKVRTMVHEISADEFHSGEVSHAVNIDFVGGEIRSRYFAVGDSATARNNRDTHWSFKYTPSTYTPALWYSLAHSFSSLKIKSGETVNLRVANCHNINTTSNIVRNQSFPLGAGDDVKYVVKLLNVDNAGFRDISEYTVHINGDERIGCVFPKETSAAMVYRQLKFVDNPEEAKKPYTLIDIGWSTSQVYSIFDGKIVSDFTLDMGIGEVQRRVRLGLSRIYSPHELEIYNLDLYMRDAGQLAKHRQFNNVKFLEDVVDLVRINGQETAETLVNSSDAGYLRQVVLAGGGGVQLMNLITTALVKRQDRGDILNFNLPTLLLEPTNNEYGNALGAFKGIWARNGG